MAPLFFEQLPIASTTLAVAAKPGDAVVIATRAADIARPQGVFITECLREQGQAEEFITQY